LAATITAYLAFSLEKQSTRSEWTLLLIGFYPTACFRVSLSIRLSLFSLARLG
jgi:hypothetical protein